MSSSNSTTSSYPPGYLEQNRSAPLTGLCITFIFLDVVTYVLRLWARRIQGTRWQWADVLMPFSLLCCLGCSICGLLAVKYGSGRHVAALSRDDQRRWDKVTFDVLPNFYFTGCVWAKLAILDIYLHVFTTRFLRWTTYATGIILILNMIINIPLALVQCPAAPYYTEIEHPKHCINSHLHTTWCSFANIVTDLIMLLLPLPLIYRLDQPWGTKMLTLLTFMVGNIGLAASLARFIELYPEKPGDITYNDLQGEIWTVIEPSVYHVCACFITLRPLVRHWLSFMPRIANLFASGTTHFKTKNTTTMKSALDVNDNSNNSMNNNNNTTQLHPEQFPEPLPQSTPLPQPPPAPHQHHFHIPAALSIHSLRHSLTSNTSIRPDSDIRPASQLPTTVREEKEDADTPSSDMRRLTSRTSTALSCQESRSEPNLCLENVINVRREVLVRRNVVSEHFEGVDFDPWKNGAL